MTDFSLFDEAFTEYNKTTPVDTEMTDTCLHEDTSVEGGVVTCNVCGQEISKSIHHEKEWRYYGPSDVKRGSDPNRVQMRKEAERSIFKDVESMGFSDKVVYSANTIYSQVTQGQIYRGASRRAIIFACIFHAYKLSGKPKPHEELIRIFGLNKKTSLRGLKLVNICAPKDSLIHTTYITPATLINDIMDKFNATDNQKQEVTTLYDRTKNKSSRLNRARPQSVASGITYYWICSKGVDITLKRFAEKVDLSELTISKIAKEISKVLGTPEII
jgi:transcription initiation factor TFIIIB Brf1 subunit/transcription initiation factor TFIIB